MDATETTATPKPKKRKPLRLLMGIVLLGGLAAGGALYAQNAGLIRLPGLAGGDASAAENPDRPQLVPRSGASPTSYAVKGARPVEADQFQVSYYPMKENFTSNLRDGGGFIQVGLGVSTYYDERVLQNLERHEMAVRSAVLMQLADQDPTALAAPEGKLALKARLAKAINGVLTEKEGFGGIDEVYFTGFVIQ
jgi:flagellar FliL protein